MELLTTSVLTLLLLYVIYSEPIKLPAIIKKNKKLFYVFIISLYLYYHQNNVEPYSSKKHSPLTKLGMSLAALPVSLVVSVIPALIIAFFMYRVKKSQDFSVEPKYSNFFHEVLRLIFLLVTVVSIIYIWIG